MEKIDAYPNLKAKQKKLAEALVEPESTETLTQLCKKFKISPAVFYKWFDTDSEFKGYISHLIDSYTDSELANVWKSLINEANSGNVSAIKLFFELKDKYRQQIKVKSEVVFIAGEEQIAE